MPGSSDPPGPSPAGPSPQLGPLTSPGPLGPITGPLALTGPHPHPHLTLTLSLTLTLPSTPHPHPHPTLTLTSPSPSSPAAPRPLPRGGRKSLNEMPRARCSGSRTPGMTSPRASGSTGATACNPRPRPAPDLPNLTLTCPRALTRRVFPWVTGYGKRSDLWSRLGYERRVVDPCLHPEKWVAWRKLRLARVPPLSPTPPRQVGAQLLQHAAARRCSGCRSAPRQPVLPRERRPASRQPDSLGIHEPDLNPGPSPTRAEPGRARARARAQAQARARALCRQRGGIPLGLEPRSPCCPAGCSSRLRGSPRSATTRV